MDSTTSASGQRDLEGAEQRGENQKYTMATDDDPGADRTEGRTWIRRRRAGAALVASPRIGNGAAGDHETG